MSFFVKRCLILLNYVKIHLTLLKYVILCYFMLFFVNIGKRRANVMKKRKNLRIIVINIKNIYFFCRLHSKMVKLPVNYR